MTRRTGPRLRDRRRPRRSRPPGRAAVLAVVVALAGPLATPTTGFAQDRHVVVTGADGLAWLNPPGESGDSTLIETMLPHRYSNRYRRFAPISRAAYLRSIH